MELLYQLSYIGLLATISVIFQFAYNDIPKSLIIEINCQYAVSHFLPVHSFASRRSNYHFFILKNFEDSVVWIVSVILLVNSPLSRP